MSFHSYRRLDRRGLDRLLTRLEPLKLNDAADTAIKETRANLDEAVSAQVHLTALVEQTIARFASSVADLADTATAGNAVQDAVVEGARSLAVKQASTLTLQRSTAIFSRALDHFANAAPTVLSALDDHVKKLTATLSRHLDRVPAGYVPDDHDQATTPADDRAWAAAAATAEKLADAQDIADALRASQLLPDSPRTLRKLFGNVTFDYSDHDNLHYTEPWRLAAARTHPVDRLRAVVAAGPREPSWTERLDDVDRLANGWSRHHSGDAPGGASVDEASRGHYTHRDQIPAYDVAGHRI